MNILHIGAHKFCLGREMQNSICYTLYIIKKISVYIKLISYIQYLFYIRKPRRYNKKKNHVFVEYNSIKNKIII